MDKTAWVLETDGSKREVQPANGTDFQVEEVQKLLGTDIVQMVEVPSQMIVLMDEEGKFKRSEINYQATILLADNLLEGDVIVGPVLYCAREMFK